MNWVLIILETQVIKKKRPVQLAFPDDLSVSYDYGERYLRRNFSLKLQAVLYQR